MNVRPSVQAARSEFLLLAAIPPLGGVLLGGGAILVARQGAGTRPALALAVLALGAAAGLLPLRFGLPVAIVLSAFGGFYLDFVHWHASYWNELFVLGVVARGALARRPARWELVGAGLLAALFLGYLATGTSARAVFWGAKVLLLSALAGWAIWRLRPGLREWRATYAGLAALVASSVVYAAWQHHVGLSRLRSLGLADERIRPTGEGFRVFAGFTSGSACAYALAIAGLVWLSFALGRSDRVVAVATAWVPAAAAIGIAWSHNRLTQVALAAAVLVVAASEAFRARESQAAALGLGLVAAAAVIGAVWSVQRLGHSGSSATFRTALWREYVRELRPTGAGPASAGSAYKHVQLEYAPPFAFGTGWPETFDQHGVLVRGMSTRATLIVGAWDARNRPRLTLVAGLGSPFRPRVLTIHLGGRRVARLRIPAVGYPRFRISVPPGTGAATLSLRAVPPATPISGPHSYRVAVRFAGLTVEGAPRPRDPTLRVYRRIWERSHDPQSQLVGITPGLVDNQYVAWLFEYGVFGAALALVWLAAMVLPLLAGGARRDARVRAGTAAGVFVTVAALGVNVWEEAPIDFLAAVLLALAWTTMRAGESRGMPAPKRMRP